MNEVILDILD